MKYLDLTFPTPAENLACDEALLDWCENGHCADEILHVWEPVHYFVVAGYANKAATEVNLPACESRQVPVLRRCSGGGTVLQGPGCLNYTLILEIAGADPLRSIATTNRFVMNRNREALGTLLNRPVNVQGHTDLAIDGLKCSGNSQRRRRRFLLFHGTFLLNFDLRLVEELLPLPSQQPGYRQNRAHTDFLTNLNLPAEELKAALRETWSANSPLETPPLRAMAALARGKYTTREWNFRF